MAVTVSLINMKGGVGKTTLATQLAHAADRRDLRTLVVDLDPQANLSQAILTPPRYVKLLEEHKPTIAAVFEQYAAPQERAPSPRPVDIHDVIVRKAGYWRGTTLDLLPSRLELANTLKNPTGKERRLAKALSRIADEYDLILLDCAPTESILTQAAYHASRFALVPVKPEFMATIGLPLLARSIKEFRYENTDHALDICGIAFNHSSAYCTLGPETQTSVREVQDEAAKHSWHVYDTHLRYSASYPKAAREGTPICSTSHARNEVALEFDAFFEEFLSSVGLLEDVA